MRATRFAPAIVAVCLAAAAGCSDAVAPNRSPPSRPPTPSSPPLISLQGFVHVTGADESPLVLELPGGEEIALVGANATPLDRVDKAEVEVRGEWNGDGAFTVADFVVRSVDGTPVVDGILVRLYDMVETDGGEAGELGYAIRLTRGGMIALADPSPELRIHIGERVWVAASSDGITTVFGIIGE